MLLSRPLETVVSSEKAAVLTVLDRAGRPLSGRTIAALTETVSQSTVSRLLVELVRHGLVERVPGGYELNRDHLSYPALEMLLGAHDELRRRVAADVASWDATPLAVVLFGSVARRQEVHDSDIDLLVVRPAAVPFDDERWSADVAALGEHVSRWSGSSCEVLEYTLDELAELHAVGDPLIGALCHDGITVVGESLDALLESGRA